MEYGFLNKLTMKVIILGIFSLSLGCASTPSEQKLLMGEGFQSSLPAPEEPQSEMVEPLSSEEEPSLGLQVASGALSVLYTPFKVVYAGLGGLMGGLAYLVTAGNAQTAQSVWDASLHGTYWLTPNHLQGKEAIRFKGEPSPTEPLHQVRLDEVVGGVVK